MTDKHDEKARELALKMARHFMGDGPAGELLCKECIEICAAALREAAGEWLDISTAPEDEAVLIATTGGWVGEARLMPDPEEQVQAQWEWAGGHKLHPNYVVKGWRPMPPSPTDEGRG